MLLWAKNSILVAKYVVTLTTHQIVKFKTNLLFLIVVQFNKNKIESIQD